MNAKRTNSAGGVVLNKEGQVLIVNQRGKSWSLPKGHIEAGEDPLTAARREIYEESGLNELQYIRPLGTYERRKIGLQGGEDGSEIKVLTFFLFHCEGGTPKPIDPDNPEARWVNRNEVAGMLTHPKDQEFIIAVLKDL